MTYYRNIIKCEDCHQAFSTLVTYRNHDCLTSKQIDQLEEQCGTGFEVYEQDGQLWVVDLQDGIAEAFPVERGGREGWLRPTEAPDQNFDWDAAAVLRGGPFPELDMWRTP